MQYQLECAIWEITLGCNLKCSHCGSKAGVARTDELDTKECLNLCEQLAELHCDNVALMGGEIFLRDDWFDIASCIMDLGMKLSLVSNGQTLERYIDDLVLLNPVVVGVSVDGLPKTHDMIRGVPGALKRAINSINLLREKNIQVTVITTVSKPNLKELPRLRDLFFNKGINWQLQIATPFGNFQEDQMLSYTEFYSVGLLIAALQAKYAVQNMPVIGAHCMGYHSEIMSNFKWNGCTAGISTLGITSDGKIVGCLAMGNDRFIEGNIRDQSLKSIWYNKDNFAYNRRFSKSDLGSFCRSCKFAVSCRGGCNSVSYSVTKQFHNNPYCYYRIEKELLK